MTSSPRLLLPTVSLTFKERKFVANRSEWFHAAAHSQPSNPLAPSVWPVSVSLGAVTERHVIRDLEAVKKWVTSWKQMEPHLPSGAVVWVEKSWPRLGTQQTPSALQFASAVELTRFIGQEEGWRRALARTKALLTEFPELDGNAVLSRRYLEWVEYSENDFSRLFGLLGWLRANPNSRLYTRQLPVPGIDTKWVEKRRLLVADLMGALQGRTQSSAAGEFYDLCGLTRTPARVRLRFLCPELRKGYGGLGDLEVPVRELSGARLNPARVLIVENLESGIALPEIPGTVAFMGLGHAVDQLSQIPWLQPKEGQGPQLVYWGDLDTHGLAILARVRAMFPGVQSVLMDEATLLAHKDLIVEEPAQFAAESLDNLTPAEAAVYAGLKSARWGYQVRLEQERLSWPEVLRALSEAGFPC